MAGKSYRIYYADFAAKPFVAFIIKEETSSPTLLGPILPWEITMLNSPHVPFTCLIASKLIYRFRFLDQTVHCHPFCFRHTAIDVEPKPKEAERPPPPPPPTYSNHASLAAPPDPQQQQPVIVKSVPSLRNLSENHLPEKVTKMRDVKGSILPCSRLFLQSKSVAAETCRVASNNNGRPIYPNCPFSPYGSPTGSPRSNRKRQPLKESRRVSIEKSGMYIQLNQYKLMDAIGQVGCGNGLKIKHLI